jgi:8-oxo-dGTP pyrophosphatase MutT (NUDIX family)
MPISPYVRALREKIGHDLIALQAATVVVFDDDGRLLLAQEAASGLWMTIGGAIEPDEAPADAAVRECWEETGLVVELVRLIGVFGGPHFRVSYSNGDIVSYISIVFEGRPISGRLRPDGEEAGALRFVSRQEAATLAMTPLTAQIVDRAFDRGAPSYFARPSWTPTDMRHP